MLDLLYNLMLESTGRLQKCRIYEMTDNKTARSTIAYLIVRDQAHENAYAKALETLGVDWGKVLPIPKTDAEQFPEVKKLLDLGLQSKQYSLRPRRPVRGGQIFQGIRRPRTGPRSTRPSRRPQGVPIDDRRGAVRGVLPRPRRRPAGPHPGHGRPGDGRGVPGLRPGVARGRRTRKGNDGSGLVDKVKNVTKAGGATTSPKKK